MSRRSERFRKGAWNPAEVFETSEGLSSLSVPTHTVSDVHFEGHERTITKESPNRGVGLPLWAERIRMLRTPTAAEVEGGPVSPEVAKAKGQTLRLTGQLLDLLPTPNTMDMLPARDESKIDYSKGGYANVRETVVRPNFGQFAPAIERWEIVTGNRACEPTIPDGRDGQHRLNARFTEWMMGLREGWITGLGLSRKDEIKMCGNGVVPQQARLALKILRNRYDRAGDKA